MLLYHNGPNGQSSRERRRVDKTLRTFSARDSDRRAANTTRDVWGVAGCGVECTP